MSLAGARCAVTGASSGVGAAVAGELARRGAAVTGFARRFSGGADVSPGQVTERRLDVTDARAVAAELGGCERLDALVLAAGGGAFGAVAGLGPAQLRVALEVHVLGTLACLQAALPGLRAAAGRVVVVSSIATRVTFAGCGGYAAAKAGQLALVRAFAEEVRGDGVAVTSVILGATDTPIWDARPEFDRRRMLRADDVAGAIVDVIARPGVRTEELVLLPPDGYL